MPQLYRYIVMYATSSLGNGSAVVAAHVVWHHEPMSDGVVLYWIPIGAGVGGGLVRWSGRAYEALAAGVQRRPRCDLYHSALVVVVDGTTSAIEMAPVWSGRGDHGGILEGAVGTPWLGRWRLFRYEVRCWEGGSIPDIAAAVGGPVHISDDPTLARQILRLAPRVPARTWGRDELETGEMWNSNSLISWLLVSAGVDPIPLVPPGGGRAPGWIAGVVEASRSTRSVGADVGRRPPTAADRELSRTMHHRAYRAVVERQFGQWDESVQDAYFDRAWNEHPHELLTVGDTIVGYAAIEVDDDKVIVHELVVAPEHQGRGVGTAVLLETIGDARRRSAPVTLRVLIQNDGATRLYHRNGFVEYGRTDTHRLMRIDT
jgi:ribosomal protein S18 acetylase RimI-like enzyme